MKPQPFPAGSIVAAYLRDSGGREQDLSVPQQIEAFQAFCQSNNLTPGRIFTDLATSGGSTVGREQFLEMVDYFRHSPPEAGVVFWSYSRFSRSYDDTQYYLADLRRRKVIVFSLSDAVEDTLDGRILESLLAWKDAKFRQDLARDIRRGQRFIASAHKAYPLGTLPPGLARSYVEIGQHRDGSPRLGARVVHDPATAPAVIEAFRLRAAGWTLAEIHLKTHLYRSVISYGKMLKNPLYIGILRLGDDEYPGFCDPLIDPGTWEQVQAVNDERRARHGYNHPRQVRSRFILTGLLRCSLCGSPMHGRVAQSGHYKRYDYYRCQEARGRARTCSAHLIPKDTIEERVIERLLAEVFDRPEVLAEIQERANRRAAEQDASLSAEAAAAAEKLRQVSARVSRLVSAIQEAGHSPALLRQLAELEAEQVRLERDSTRLSAAKPDPLRIDLHQVASSVRHTLRQGTDAERATVLRGYVRLIAVRREQGGEVTGLLVCVLDDQELFVSL